MSNNVLNAIKISKAIKKKRALFFIKKYFFYYW